ncbi:MAG: starch-binding protein [Oscillospiraceae bacterium]|jgi:glucan-binding YG repeat protein|nr:starch-binding protein [Oscillospiraceae bacterium]
MAKRILSIILTAVMVAAMFSVCAVTAVAADGSDSSEIYFRKAKTISSGWYDIYAYMYKSGSSAKNAEWPGQKMAYLEADDNYYYYTLNANLSLYDTIIFNDNGGNQTNNIPIGEDYAWSLESSAKSGGKWSDVVAFEVVTEEEPTVPPTEPTEPPVVETTAEEVTEYPTDAPTEPITEAPVTEPPVLAEPITVYLDTKNFTPWTSSGVKSGLYVWINGGSNLWIAPTYVENSNPPIYSYSVPAEYIGAGALFARLDPTKELSDITGTTWDTIVYNETINTTISADPAFSTFSFDSADGKTWEDKFAGHWREYRAPAEPTEPPTEAPTEPPVTDAPTEAPVTEPPVPSEDITVYLENNYNWAPAAIYYWGAETSGTINMTATGASGANGDLWSAVIPGTVLDSADGILFRNEYETAKDKWEDYFKTEDIAVADLHDNIAFYFDSTTNVQSVNSYTYTPAEPTEAPTEDEPEPAPEVKYYLAGTVGLVGEEVGAWNVDGLEMTKIDDNTYGLVFEHLVKGTYEFKVTNGAWYDSVESPNGHSWNEDGLADSAGNAVIEITWAWTTVEIIFHVGEDVVNGSYCEILIAPTGGDEEPTVDEPTTAATEPVEPSEPITVYLDTKNLPAWASSGVKSGLYVWNESGNLWIAPTYVTGSNPPIYSYSVPAEYIGANALFGRIDPTKELSEITASTWDAIVYNETIDTTISADPDFCTFTFTSIAEGTAWPDKLDGHWREYKESVPPTEPPTAPPTADITVYLENKYNWAPAAIFYWTSNSDGTIPMTATGNYGENGDIWSAVIPGEVLDTAIGILFRNNFDATKWGNYFQTEDIAIADLYDGVCFYFDNETVDPTSVNSYTYTTPEPVISTFELTEANIGDTVTATYELNLPSDKIATSLDVHITYSSDVIEFERISIPVLSGGNLMTNTGEEGKIYFNSSAYYHPATGFNGFDFNDEGKVLATITFKVIAAGTGSVDLNIRDLAVADSTTEDLSYLVEYFTVIDDSFSLTSDSEAITITPAATEPEPDPTDPEPDPTDPEPDPTDPITDPTDPDPDPTDPEPDPTNPEPEPVGGWVKTLFGTRYFYSETSYYYSGWYTIDDVDYFFEAGYRLEGGLQLVPNAEGVLTWYFFNEDGTRDLTVEIADGFYTDRNGYAYAQNGLGLQGFQQIGDAVYFFSDNGYAQKGEIYGMIFGEDYKGINEIVEKEGTLYLYLDGVTTANGLYKVGDDYYLSNWGGVIFTDGRYHVETTYCDMPAGRSYYFGADGKMLNGVLESDDTSYLYINGDTTSNGLYKIGDDYYLSDWGGINLANGRYHVANTYCDLPAGRSYYFGADGKMLNGIYDGILYINGDTASKGLFKIGDDYYLSYWGGVIFTDGRYHVDTTYCDIPAGWSYYFGADGKMLNGVVENEGTLYLYINGDTTSKGLYKIGDDYYLSDWGGVITTDGRYHVVTTYCDLPADRSYYFGADGKMLNGIVENDGTLYLYINGDTSSKGLYKIGDDYYLSDWGGVIKTDGSYHVDTTYCDLSAGLSYSFGADGKMLNGMVEIDGILYLYINGITTPYGLFELDGDYYFASWGGVINTDGTYYVDVTNCDLPIGNYTFGVDGKMLDGFVTKTDGIYLYQNGNPAPLGLIAVDGDYYYVTEGGKLITDQTFFAEITNGLSVPMEYTFDASGKVIA